MNVIYVHVATYVYYIVKMTVRDKYTLKITHLNYLRYYLNLNLKTLIIQSGIADVKERGNMWRSIYMYIYN